MNKKNKKLYIILLTVTAILSAILLMYLVRVPVNSYVLPVSSATPDIGRMETDGYYFDAEHASEITENGQKIYFNIPTSVAKGSYTLRIGYRSGSASNISVTSLSDPWAVKCDQVALTHVPEELPGEFNMNYGLGYLPGFSNSEIYITKDINDLDVYVIYSGFQDFHIESVELIGNRNFIKTIFPVFVFILLLIDIIISIVFSIKNRIKGYTFEKQSARGMIANYVLKEHRILVNCCSVLIIGLLCSVPLLFKMGLLFDDGYFLYGRFNGIADGLLEGQFPVRVHPNTINGYGYAVSCFYPELFLYPFALLRILGYSLRFVMYALILTMNIGTAAISFYSVRRIFKNDFFAHLGSFIYTFSLYRLIDVYSRGAIAEVLAIMFLPLIVVGLYVIIVEKGSVVPLTVSLFGLVNSHILSCEMVMFFGIILCIVCFKQIFNKDVLVRIIKSVVITALLSMYFIYPFLHMSTMDNYKVYAENAYETSQNMLSGMDLFALNISTDGAINNGSFFSTRYSLGIVIMVVSIGLFVLGWFAVNRCKQNEITKRSSTWIFTKICFGFGVIAILLSSKLFPWALIENIGGLLRTVFCMVQFPWRYLSIAMVFFMFSVCGCVNAITESYEEADRDFILNKKVTTIVALTSCILLLIQSFLYFSTLSNTANDRNLIFDGAYIRKYSCTGMGEYEPVQFDDEKIDYSIEELQYICDENAVINPTGENGNAGLTIGPLTKAGTKSSLLIINPTGEVRTLYLPILYYYGYEISNVADDPTGLIPNMYESEDGRIALDVPAGYYNGVNIEYREPLLYRIADVISLITLVSLVACSLIGRIKNIKCDKIS